MLSRNRKSSPVANVERRLFHLSVGSLIPVVALFLDEGVTIGVLAFLLLLSLGVEYTRLRYRPLNDWLIARFSVLLKEKEHSGLTGSTYLVLSCLLAFLLFDKYIAILAIFFLTVGDPLAALVGERFGNIRVGPKSLEGTAAFFLAALILGGLLSTLPQLDIGTRAMVIGAAVAAATEIVPIPVDDNLTIPLVSGGVMTALAV